MEDEWKQLEVLVSKQQLINLVINRKEIELNTNRLEKVKLSNPTRTSYALKKNSRHSEHIVYCKILIGGKSYSGRLEATSEDGKTYQGRIFFKEN